MIRMILHRENYKSLGNFRSIRLEPLLNKTKCTREVKPIMVNLKINIMNNQAVVQ